MMMIMLLMLMLMMMMIMIVDGDDGGDVHLLDTKHNMPPKRFRDQNLTNKNTISLTRHKTTLTPRRDWTLPTFISVAGILSRVWNKKCTCKMLTLLPAQTRSRTYPVNVKTDLAQQQLSTSWRLSISLAESRGATIWHKPLNTLNTYLYFVTATSLWPIKIIYQAAPRKDWHESKTA